MDNILANAPGDSATPPAATDKNVLLSGLLSRLAHEIRNPCGSLDIHLRLLEESLSIHAPEVRNDLKARLESIHGELDRLENVVKQFLRLAGPAAPDLEPAAVQTVLDHLTGKRAEPGLLTGESESIRAVMRLIEEVANSEVTVLIEGESGTGKEIVARSIHLKSPRRDHPFISVNCAAFSEQLLESELFGHAKGAFTGASTSKPGRFQLAEGGTLFLDEIGDLSPKGQGDLLRVLEDGGFRMVGGTELIRANARVVAATNKKLQEAVAAGKFREDLFYRLQVVPIVMPPLRERAEDIPLLIDGFLKHFTGKHKRRRKSFSGPALQLCQQYPWPGNVRQLRNTIERVVITTRASIIDVPDLPDFLQAHDQSAAVLNLRAGMPLAEAEKLLIRKTLIHVTDNRQKAAEVLGISRRTLQYKLKQYGLLDTPR